MYTSAPPNPSARRQHRAIQRPPLHTRADQSSAGRRKRREEEKLTGTDIITVHLRNIIPDTFFCLFFYLFLVLFPVPSPWQTPTCPPSPDVPSEEFRDRPAHPHRQGAALGVVQLRHHLDTRTTQQCGTQVPGAHRV